MIQQDLVHLLGGVSPWEGGEAWRRASKSELLGSP